MYFSGLTGPFSVQIPESQVTVIADSCHGMTESKDRAAAASVVVTTVAGTGDRSHPDGVGLAAAFFQPNVICYSSVTGVMLVAEIGSHRIRRVFPVGAKWKCEFERIIHSLLSNDIPIQPVVSIIASYCIGNST